MRHALVVAVESYDQLPQLRNAGAVGNRVAFALQRLGFLVHLEVNPTQQTLMKCIDELESELKHCTGEEHLVVFYFVGHGEEHWNGELLLRLRDASRNDSSGSLALLAFLRRLLDIGPRIGVLLVPDCCRENNEDSTFTLGIVRPPEAILRNRDTAASTSLDEGIEGNFCIAWAGDKGTTITNSNDESLGSQLAACLQEAPPGQPLRHVLGSAGEQVTLLHRDKRRNGLQWELQRPGVQWGRGSRLGQHVLKPVLCARCARFRLGRDYGGHNCNGCDKEEHSRARPPHGGLLTAEGFANILGSKCQTPDACAVAALQILERRAKGPMVSASTSTMDGPDRPAALSSEHSAFFCAAVRASGVPVLRWMLHLHPRLIHCHDAFDSASEHRRGRPSASAARATPAVGVAAAGPARQDALLFLLHAQADPRAQDKEGWNAVHEAAFTGNADAVKALLEWPQGQEAAKVGRIMSKETGKAGWVLSPLHVAAGNGHLACVELLLTASVENPSLRNVAPLGWRPAVCSMQAHAQLQDIRREETLLAVLMKRPPFEKAFGALAPEHLAAAAGYSQCLQALIATLADANMRTEHGLTPLLLCVKQRHPSKCQYAPPRKEPQSEPPDHAKVFDVLLSAGAKDSPQQGREMTALHAVAFHWGGAEPEVARRMAERLLVEANSSLEARGPAGGTPLHMAANGRNWALCSLLLERRADPSCRNDAGRAVWDLPVLQDEADWPHADGCLARAVLLSLRKELPQGAGGERNH